MLNARLYKSFIWIILIALVLPASMAQADPLQRQDSQGSCPLQRVAFTRGENPRQQPSVKSQKICRTEILSSDQSAFQMNTLSTGGPDNFGYTFDDTVSYNWITASSLLSLSGDDQYATLAPGFDFPFYGFRHSQFAVNTNGLIIFENDSVGWGGYPIPDPGWPNNLIAPFWEDLIVGVDENNGGIYYQAFGSEPNRYFVVEWRDVELLGGSVPFSFEAILYENGDIVFQYQSLPAEYYSTVGIEDSIGGDGLEYQHGTSELSTPKAVQFFFPAPSAQVLLSPLDGGNLIPSGENHDFTITLTNTGNVGADTYDLIVGSSWLVSLYASNGMVLLTDTNDDTVIDTGPLAQGASADVIVRVTAPENARVGDGDTIGIVAASSLNLSKTRYIEFSTSVPAGFVNVFDEDLSGAMNFMTVSQFGISTSKVNADYQLGEYPAVSVLPNGNYIYVWSFRKFTGSYWYADIEYAILDDHGKLVRPVTKLTNNASASMMPYDYLPSVSAAPNGTVGVVWVRDISDDADRYNQNVYLATLDISGKVLSSPANITNNTGWTYYGVLNAKEYYDATIASTTDNRFVLSWRLDVKSGPSIWQSNIWIAGRNTAGANVFSPKAVTSDGVSWESVLNSLTNGSVILTWMTEDLGPNYEVINSSGSLVKSATSLGATGYSLSADAVLLSNGKTAVAWTTSVGVAYSILNSSFTIESGPHTTTSPHFVGGNALSITTDPASHVILSWTGEGDEMFYALADSTGSFITDPIDYWLYPEYYIYPSWNGQGIAPYGRPIDIKIGNTLMGQYGIPSKEVLVESYAGILNGPVKVSSPDKSSFFTSQRAISGDSFNEVMGYPTNQLTTEYWFPWYDNASMSTWILVGNPSTTSAASVDIYIGGIKKGTYSIPKGGRVTPRYAGFQGGPVRVVSTNGVKIFTSERTQYGPNDTFNEMMGYPANQFTTEYWFPWYDNVSMATWIVVGNSSSTQTAAVNVYVGTAKKSYSIPPKSSISQRYPGLQGGPVRVVSTNGVNVITSERTVAGNSFNEVMGSPANQFTMEYWYPWYDNSNMATWVLVGNPTGSTASVSIYIGSAKYSYTIPAGGRITPRFTGMDVGPVRVVSTNGIKIFTSERVMYKGAFNEVMGYPGNKLSSEYWFPWYDSTSMSTDILVGRP
jgi:hypothetical protein